MKKQLFDAWPEKYRSWFQTPIGALVKSYEQDLILELLQPEPDELVLDVGCGSGIFTEAVVDRGARVIGLDVSEPMLQDARHLLPAAVFMPVAADMRSLPFGDGHFDKTLCITALEFVKEAGATIEELFRVTRRNGTVVIATLNSLSPWAARRKEEASNNEGSIFRNAYFRSPEQLRALVPVPGEIRTAIHFDKNFDVLSAKLIESEGREERRETGAFLIGCWRKP